METKERKFKVGDMVRVKKCGFRNLTNIPSRAERLGVIRGIKSWDTEDEIYWVFMVGLSCVDDGEYSHTWEFKESDLVFISDDMFYMEGKDGE